jgi:hypothetical protein
MLAKIPLNAYMRMSIEELRAVRVYEMLVNLPWMHTRECPYIYRRVESSKGVWDVDELTLNAYMKMFIEELRAIRVIRCWWTYLECIHENGQGRVESNKGEWDCWWTNLECIQENVHRKVEWADENVHGRVEGNEDVSNDGEHTLNA